MFGHNKIDRRKILIGFIVLGLFLVLYYIFSLRFKTNYLTNYTKKHFGYKYIYTNKFDNLNHFGRGKNLKYILLSENTNLLEKYTKRELNIDKAVVLYFYPIIKTTKSKLYERLLKMTFYDQNFLITKSGFLITKEKVPHTNRIFVSEFIHDSLRGHINRVYSNDAPFFKKMIKISIWLPIANDSLLDSNIRIINKLIDANRAVIAYYYQSYYTGRVTDKYLLNYFSDTAKYLIRKFEDGLVILNKKAFLKEKTLNQLKAFLTKHKIKTIYTNNIYPLKKNGLNAYWLPPRNIDKKDIEIKLKHLLTHCKKNNEAIIIELTNTKYRRLTFNQIKPYLNKQFAIKKFQYYIVIIPKDYETQK